MKKIHKCKDCNCIIKNFYATRCRSCAGILRSGKNNPMFGKKRPDVSERNHNKFKGGLPKCLDCGKQLAHYKSKRCKKCANCGKLNPRFGIKESINAKTKRIQKIIKLIHKSPNKLETIIDKLLNTLLPNKYKFVGDGTVIFDGLNPDFINIKAKKIIEFYGDYWHNQESYKIRDKRRLKTYKKYGYKTLIIWEHELKDLDKLNTKILNFC